MKRSEVNALLNWAKALLHKNNFYLPMFGYWTMDEWKKHKSELGRIKDTMLGWDVTDFGSGDFNKIGAVLFTIRNGNVNKNCGTPYAEKVILMKKGQMLPLHFHYTKTEDIINRGGGTLVLKFYASKPDGSVDTDSDVTVYCDGIKKVFKAGERCEVPRGCSVTLTPYIYHLFLAEGEDLIIGEVSKINDDNFDNHFAEEAKRFSKIEEDEPILHPLCNEYDRGFWNMMLFLI
jgi:D-lyxose ketol-isomerase